MSLKRGFGHVETPRVKSCPHCDAELRDSVITCTRCGRSLREPREPREPEPVQPTSAAVVGNPQPVPASTAVAEAPRPSGVPSARAFAPAGASWDAPPGPTSALAEVEAHRALPTAQRSGGPDLWLMWAGLGAIVAGVLAYLTVKDPWVHITISLPETDFEEAFLAELTVRD